MNTITDYGQREAAADGSAFAHREGPIARMIEKTTARIPSDVFLWVAGAAMIGSLAFQILGPKPKRGLFGRRVEGRAPIAGFVGQWVPTLLVIGLYNKVVKVAGSDRVSR